MIKRIVLMMVLTVALIFAGAQDNQAEAYSGGYVSGIRTYLSIRESPSVYSRELARIPNGTYLQIYHREGSFYYVYVDYCRIYGYAHASYVSFY